MTRHSKVASKRHTKAKAAPPGRVRIIAGRWRGRKLAVPVVDGLRPTGDRLRETLFSWLHSHIAGARCLDLFAGSGALGFEALSRYAASVVFVESDSTAYRSLTQSCDTLGIHRAKTMPDLANLTENDGGSAHLYAGPALQAIDVWKGGDERPLFDLVFIDPPFRLGCQWEMLARLAPLLLAQNARIYLESPSDQPIPEALPAGCDIIREKCLGDVTAHLVHFACTSR